MVKVKKKKQNIKKMQPQDIPLIRLIQKGPQALSNIELLTILLGKDVNWVGTKLLMNWHKRFFKNMILKDCLKQVSVNWIRYLG